MKKSFLLLMLSMVVFSCYTQSKVEYRMKMWTSFNKILWDSTQISTWGFSEGSKYPPLPGPTLYAVEGDTVVISIRNQSQGAPHTIHWHGLDVDQANDGVPQTSFVLEHIQDSTYTFIAPHPGTYLYHCHVASIVHVQMGMYGSFIIKPKGNNNVVWEGGPSYDVDYLWLMSEVDKSWHQSPPIHYSTDSLYPEFQFPNYEPDYFLINGNSYHQFRVDGETDIYTSNVSDVALLRLSNIGYHINQVVFPSSISAQVISADGRPLPEFEFQDTLLIGPGERFGVLLESSSMSTDSIEVNYLDINNQVLLSTQYGHVKFGQGTSVEQQKQLNNVIIYPNPSDGIFYIKGEFITGTILDVNGRQVLDINSKHFNLHELPKGVYFAKFETEEYYKTIKLIKQ